MAGTFSATVTCCTLSTNPRAQLTLLLAMAPKHCDSDCKHNGAASKGGKALEMVRCCFCMRWFHANCMKDKNETFENIWNCLTCRMMPTQITTLLASLSQLTCVVNELKDEQEKLKAETTALKCEISELKCKFDEMKNSQTYSSVVQNNNPSTQTRNSLLIGDSVIRDIDQEKLSETTVKCLPGATIKRVHDELQKIDPTESHSKIFIVAGTNDYAKEDKTIQDTIEQFSNLLSYACSKADDVVVSSICPRQDISRNEEDLAAFNAGLQSLCEDKGCVFVDHTQTFTLGDGSVNEGFLLNKGPHLSRAGSNRLAKNLKLQVKGDDATKRRQNTGFNTRTSGARRGRNYNQERGCYNCGERNHVSNNCRHGQPVVCTSCNGRGHKAKFCRQS